MRIGFLQTRGLGDIIIALPIAQHYISKGHEIIWPIDQIGVDDFRHAEPRVKWLPVEAEPNTKEYFLDEPMGLMEEVGCKRILKLYSYLPDYYEPRKRLSQTLKFDEYKYAIANLPFHLKWSLDIDRDMEREERLFESLGISGDFAVAHLIGTEKSADLDPRFLHNPDLPVIHIKEGAARLFDWLTIIERAAEIVMIDSVYANIVEQLNLAPRTPKTLILRSPARFTPVFASGWRFV